MLMGSAAAAPGASICVWGSHDARACRAQCSPWRRLEFDISTRSQPRLSHSHRFKRFPSRISMPSKGQSNQFLKLNRRSNNFIWSFHTPFGVHLSPRLVQLTLQHFLVVLVCFGFPFNNHILAADVSAGVSYECMDEIHYYKSLDGLMGKRLEQKLYSLIKSHHVVPYAQVWEALMLLDAVDAKNPEMCSDVVEIYSQRRVSKKLAGKPDGWNREHLWPRSYGLTKGHPDFSDLHNLRPADVNVNSARGNKYYGDCTQKKSKTCYVPANREAALDTATDKAVWLPPSRVRGDIARSLMYMAVRYGSNDPSTNVTLQLSDTPNDGIKEYMTEYVNANAVRLHAQ